MKVNVSSFFSYILVSFIVITGCETSNTDSESSTKNTDSESSVKNDDNETKAKESSEIIWMEQNLDVETFRNGDPIPEIKSDEAWKQAQQDEKPGWCYYDNDPANGKKYGKLYNWFAVNDPRGLAPEGWRIPTKEEFKKYIDDLGKNSGDKMKSTSGWTEHPNGKETNGTNESGFNGLPGGYRNPKTNKFSSIGYSGDWWTSTESASNAWHYSLNFQNHKMSRSTNLKSHGFSVRCIKD